MLEPGQRAARLQAVMGDEQVNRGLGARPQAGPQRALTARQKPEAQPQHLLLLPRVRVERSAVAAPPRAERRNVPGGGRPRQQPQSAGGIARRE